MSIFIYVYSVSASITLIPIFIPLHILTDILKPIQYFQMSQDIGTHYICSRYECAINYTYTPLNTWEYLATYFLFHLCTTTTIPFATKYIADSIVNYLVQRITNIFIHLQIGIGSASQQILIEDVNEQDNTNINNEYAITTFFPHHMSGHIPPVTHQQHIYQYRHQMPYTYRTRPNRNSDIVSRLINMSLISEIFANRNHNDTEHDNQLTTEIPTRIDNTYVDTAMKTFAGDACSICITKFHILEIKKKTLAVTTPCSHLFCHACIEEYLNNHYLAQPQAPCPLCRHVVEELCINK